MFWFSVQPLPLRSKLVGLNDLWFPIIFAIDESKCYDKCGLHAPNYSWQSRVGKFKLVCLNDTTTC